MSKNFNKMFESNEPVKYAEGGFIADENYQVAVEEEKPEMQHAEVVEQPEPENDANNVEDADNIDDGLKSHHAGGSDYVYQGNF